MFFKSKLFLNRFFKRGKKWLLKKKFIRFLTLKKLYLFKRKFKSKKLLRYLADKSDDKVLRKKKYFSKNTFDFRVGKLDFFLNYFYKKSFLKSHSNLIVFSSFKDLLQTLAFQKKNKLFFSFIKFF